MSVEWRRAFAQGLRDGGVAGWPSGWDNASNAEQIAYEQGRLWACAMRALGVTVPAWDGGRAGASAVETARRPVLLWSGNPVPPDWDEGR